MSSSNYPPLHLNPRADQRIKKGHLWIYSNEVDTQKSPLKQFEQGQLVSVISDKGRGLGTATLNPQTLLAGRILSRDPNQTIDVKFLARKIKQAAILRDHFFKAPYYRLVYGDSDFLPGVIVDRFGDYLVLQINTAGMEKLKAALVEALQKVINPKGILIANSHTARSLEELELYNETVGVLPEQFELEENNTKFIVPAQGGQKTGWFYDHRMNRAMLQQFSQDKTVLDVFSYVGGWAMQAATAGAKSISCVDASTQALDYAERNAELNNCADIFTGYQGKAADALKTLIEERHKYDIVILDPPAFIKRKKDQKAGLKAYHQMNSLALRLVDKSGLLISGSCSMHLEQSALIDTVRSAAGHVDRDCQLIFTGSQGPDHPIHPAIAETSYLKALFFRVLQR